MKPPGMLGDIAERRFFGLAEAIVVDVADPEREGRVRLRLPWFDSTEVGDWCRVCSLFAGDGHGSTFGVEVGAEVLVAFVHGDPRVPVVLGGLYNGKDKPPHARTADTNRRAFRTPAGHEVLLDDSPGSHAVEVRTGTGHRVHLDDETDAIRVEVAGGPSMTMTGDGHLEIRAKTITIAAGDDLVLTGATIRLN